MRSEDPRLVVNAAAYNQVDIAETEPQAAFEANAWRSETLLWPAVKAAPSWSTTPRITCSMALKGSPYVETDPTHPLGAYAVSKLAGELYAQAYLDEC